jgi:hypothetical protein
MSVFEFEPKKPKKRSLANYVKILSVISAISTCLVLGFTFAGNINLTASGNERVQFGQGVTRTVVCGDSDVQVTLTPKSVFVNANKNEGGGAFYFTGVTLSNIPSDCIGTSFKFKAYTLNNQNNLQLNSCANDGTVIAAQFNGDDTSNLTDASSTDFGNTAAVSNATTDSFELNWAYTCSADHLTSANDIYRITVESLLATSHVKSFNGNGHYYEYIDVGVTWNEAYDAVEVRNLDGSCKYTYMGMCGYLATVTSSAENNFINTKVGTNEAWLGAADAGGRYLDVSDCGGWDEGYWRWVSGPEKCQRFSAISNPVNGVTVPGTYENWSGGEPNNSGTENAAQILSGGNGFWNDLPQTNYYMGYVVEYSPGYTG